MTGQDGEEKDEEVQTGRGKDKNKKKKERNIKTAGGRRRAMKRWSEINTRM